MKNKTNYITGLFVILTAVFGGVQAHAQSWGNIGTAGTLTNGRLCYSDGTDIICDTGAPTVSAVSSSTADAWQLSGSDLYYNGGNVGIGIANPTATLDVSGSGVDTGFSLTRSDIGSGGKTFDIDWGGSDLNFRVPTSADYNWYFGDNILMTVDATGQVSAVSFVGDGSGLSNVTATPSISGSAGQVLFNSDGSTLAHSSNLYWDETNDRLGIGTSSPTGLLDVKSSSGNAVVEIDAASGSNARQYFSDGGAIKWNIGHIGSSGNFNVYDAQTATSPIQIEQGAPTNALFLNASGNVGIGTSSPGAKLEVSGTSYLLGNVAIGDNSHSVSNLVGQGAVLSNYDGGAIGRLLLDVEDITSGYATRIAQTDTGFEFQSVSNSRPIIFETGASLVERMRIDGVGNVGINTGSPAAPLHVSNTSVTTEDVLVRFSSGNGRNMDILQPDAADGNDPFTFFTNNAFQFRVDAKDALFVQGGGRIGINTTSPSTELDVSGTVTADYFSGDGSGLTNLPSSSAWTEASDDIYFTGGNVAIGTSDTTNPFMVDLGGEQTAQIKAYLTESTMGSESWHYTGYPTLELNHEVSGIHALFDGTYNAKMFISLEGMKVQSNKNATFESTDGSAMINSTGNTTLQVNSKAAFNVYGGSTPQATLNMPLDVASRAYVGTSTPSGVYEVAKFRASTAAGGGELQILSNVDTSSVTHRHAMLQASSSGASRDLILNPYGGDVAVGISPTSVRYPQYTLDVYGNTNNAILALHSNSDKLSGILFDKWPDASSTSSGFYIGERTPSGENFAILRSTMNGNYGIGIDNLGKTIIGRVESVSPSEVLHLRGSSETGDTTILVEDINASAGSREMLRMSNLGGSYITMENRDSGEDWFLTHEHGSPNRFLIDSSTGSGPEFAFSAGGDLDVSGTVTATSFVGDGSSLTGITADVALSGSAGQVLFNSDGSTLDHASTLVWDETNDRLGIGFPPATDLHIQKMASGSAVGALLMNMSSTENSTATLTLSSSDSSLINQVYYGGDVRTLANASSGYKVGTSSASSLTLVTDDTDRMFVGANGKVGIGTTTPKNLLHIYEGSSGGTADVSGNDLVIESNYASGITLLSPSTSSSHILFGDEDHPSFGRIVYNRSSTSDSLDNMGFTVGGNTTIYLRQYSLDMNSASITGAQNIATTGYVGVGTLNPGYVSQGYKLEVNGTAAGTSWSNLSDRRFKKNITDLADPLNTVLALRGVSYEWKDPQDDMMRGTKIGVIAQEVEEVLPEVVTTGEDGTKRVDYQALVAPLIEAVKAQQVQIEALKAEIDMLKAQ